MDLLVQSELTYIILFQPVPSSTLPYTMTVTPVVTMISGEGNQIFKEASTKNPKTCDKE